MVIASSLAPAQAGQALTPEKALSYRRAGDLHFSSDGSKLAYVVSSYSWDAAPHLWLLDVATGKARQLTPDGKSERSPQWSPDGKKLAFLSNRAGKTQVFVMQVATGNIAQLTARKFGVESFHWSPDGRAIAYLAKDDTAPGEDEGPQVADDPRALSHLWVVDPNTKAAHGIATSGYRIDEFQWQDPVHLLILATDTPRVEEFHDAVYRVTANGGAISLVTHPPQPCSGLVVSPDGSALSLRATDTHGPLDRDLFVGSTAGNDLRDVTRSLDRSVVEVRWNEEPAIWARVDDGFRYRLYRIAIKGALTPVDLPRSVDTFDVARDGDIAYVGEDFDHLPELYLRTADGKIRQLARIQEGWGDIRLAATTIFRTRSFDGTEIEAALMKPRTARPGEKLPLMLLVHGGPSSNFSAGYGWETGWAQMLAAHGYEVLLVNPRGSNGYSEDFVKANYGDWGGGDYKDLMAVLDAVIAKGDTDPARLGIGGWSYGGEMTAWAIGQTNRFKAAVAGAPVFNQEAEFEAERDPAGDEWYFGTPWEHADVFARNSPATFIRNARTPTLIFDGIDDASNPVGQSKGLYRALKHFGVETQMVLYPDEGHSPVKWSYNVDMFTRILDWYDRHLKAAK
jgi:dipeptidyl aminopeptidase/acylaminoacyl peptidase